MAALKVFALLNGGFYVLYGLFGAFMPRSMLGIMGWTADQLGMHQIRAVSLAMTAIGLIIVAGAMRMTDLVPLTLAIMLLTMGFLAGRLLGLVLDGAGPQQTYLEIGIEIVVIALGAYLISRIGSAA
jgi:hypothetical protein